MKVVRFSAIVALQTAAAALLALQSDEESRLLQEANAHYLALRSEEAVTSYRKYLELYRDRADVRVFLGAALLNLNRPEEALEEARRALSLDRRYARAFVLIGRIHASKEEWSHA